MCADALTLHCPNCGAPAEPEARRCRFCKARLATVSCPSCFALMFDGAAFCPKCGARRSRGEPETAANANCPGCLTSLRPVRIGETPMLECDRCDGVWVDAEVFERLCADKASQTAVLHTFAAAKEVTSERVTYRPCVRCGKMMNRVNFGRLSGVIVDVCRGHGTYLDPGELHRIVAFIQAGGLDRARTRQLEELREKERELNERDARLARARGRSDPHGSVDLRTPWTFLVGED